MHELDDAEFRALGVLVKQRMQVLDWTIAGLAEMADISHTTLMKIRDGKIGVGSRALFPVFRLLGIRFIYGEAPSAIEWTKRLPYERHKKRRGRPPLNQADEWRKLPDGRLIRAKPGMTIGHIPRKRPSASP